MLTHTAAITWNKFPEVKPPVIYERGQIETHNFYFAVIAGKQVTVLQWHTRLTDNLARWEWPFGTVFHGNVLAWATSPTYA